MQKTLWILLSALLLVLVQGCATPARAPLQAELDAARALPAAAPLQDHYIAWVPRDAAQSATAARALAHTSLGKARKRAGDELCGGIWVGNNTIVDVIGPIPVWAGTADRGYPAWYYRITHEPGLKGCTAASDAEVYEKMQARLPAWVTIQAARADGRIQLLAGAIDRVE